PMIMPKNISKGKEVPTANTDGKMIPYGDCKATGIIQPKKSSTIVGQKPKENATPIKNAPAFPPTRSDILASPEDILNPKENLNFIHPRKNNPIRMNKGPINFRA